jgi:ABC-type branched-subunit amino acid transport system ATPase component
VANKNSSTQPSRFLYFFTMQYNLWIVFFQAIREQSMKYKRFTIKNFKGVKETNIEISNFAGASIFCFVGLNESGKTTLLEAIHSFNPDKATNQLLGGTDSALGVPIRSRVPRHLLSSFNESVIVAATLTLSIDDKLRIKALLKEKGIEVNFNDYGDEVTLD